MQISIDNVVENFFDGSRELALTVTARKFCSGKITDTH